MSIVTGKITAGGAVVDVLVGVSKNREAVLKSAGFPVPAKIALRAEIDTGSAVTGLIPEAFQQLGVEPFRVFSTTTANTANSPSPSSPGNRRSKDRDGRPTPESLRPACAAADAPRGRLIAANKETAAEGGKANRPQLPAVQEVEGGRERVIPLAESSGGWVRTSDLGLMKTLL
jgi:hypothetical protein